MKVLVVGAARSGSAVSELLARNNIEVTMTDSKEIPDHKKWADLKVKIVENGHPLSLLAEKYNYVVKNPGIPYDNPFIAKIEAMKLPIYNEIEIASQYAHHFTYGAVTGTNGKTTTTTLLHEMLLKKDASALSGGNIGIPMSEQVLLYGHQRRDVALEIAAFQLLGCPSFHPLVSVIINLTPDHLDVFHGSDAYYKAKTLVYRNQRDDDWFLKNIDDENVMTYAKDVKCKVVTFSLDKPADCRIENKRVMLHEIELFELADLKLVGRHNLQNAMVAACMAYKMGVKCADIKDAVQHFKGVEHRIEYVSEVNGVRFYNDSKGTNCDATITALKAFPAPVILLAGGYDKKTGFEPLISYMDKVKTMYIFGETKFQLKEIYPNAVITDTMQNAFALAIQSAEKGDVVLLSPSCASWDQFENYEQRGKIFKNLVKEWEVKQV